jgi:DNA-binding transcriptional LysR family regulator
MDRLEGLRVFVAVAEQAGFAAAARQLGLSPPAVTRAVAALEARLGARLLHRTTRIVRPTEAGQRFLADARRILTELEEAEASAAGAQREPRGPLSVTAPVLFGRLHMAPLVFAFRRAFPDVTVRLLLLDRIVDLIEEGQDVGLRIARLPDSGLSQIRVGSLRHLVVASPAYLARRGRPASPEQIAGHDTIVFAREGLTREWLFGADRRPVRPQAGLAVNTAEVAIAAAVEGLGLTSVLSYQAAAELAAGRLEVVLAEHQPPEIPVHLVHPEGRRASARLRAFLDFAVPRLRAEPALGHGQG